jgi:hypothetical protein
VQAARASPSAAVLVSPLVVKALQRAAAPKRDALRQGALRQGAPKKDVWSEEGVALALSTAFVVLCVVAWLVLAV